jgi:hypothetical protein
VEQITHKTGDRVLITEATRGRLLGDRFGFDRREPGELRGRSVPVLAGARVVE